MNSPRSYVDERDLAAMFDVLMTGRAANNGSYYIHIGDLKWWLYYPPLEGAFWDHIHVWDDPQQPGRLLGWALISPGWVAIDVYPRPELRGTATAIEMYLWAEQEATRLAHKCGKKTIYAAWVRHEDEVLVQHFNERGFRMGHGSVKLSRSLEGGLPSAVLPSGYTIRSCKGLPEVSARAKAQHGAFKSTATFDRYQLRFTNFMRSPAYEPALDIVVEAPDGQIGSFSIAWPDPVNKVGLFEPVGTHPDFQRKGLGRMVLLEGMCRLKQRGMLQAIVSTGEDNLPAIKLYENVGFQVTDRLGTFEKDV